ncbi:FxsA family protein [Nocardioides alkalitolerans]|uniref:FxsA family protein n=1 Tax=Nocardioides alkalitolerans TaxID=281714 RepID=UPI000412D033|nr:FxsA family protein [Nocardioides alkalitolerans]
MSGSAATPTQPGRPGPSGPTGPPPGAVRSARLRALRFTLPLVLGVAIEVVAVVAVAGWIGLGWTLLLLLASTVAGFFFLGREGRKAWSASVEAARAGRPPGDEVVGGVLVFVGAVLMILPGLVNGVVGLAVILGRPLLRRPISALLTRRARRYGVTADAFAPGAFTGAGFPGGAFPGGGFPGGGARRTTQSGDVVEGEVVDPPRDV